MDQFLEAIAPPQFEIVVYTAEQGMVIKIVKIIYYLLFSHIIYIYFLI